MYQSKGTEGGDMEKRGDLDQFAEEKEGGRQKIPVVN